MRDDGWECAHCGEQLRGRDLFELFDGPCRGVRAVRDRAAVDRLVFALVDHVLHRAANHLLEGAVQDRIRSADRYVRARVAGAGEILEQLVGLDITPRAAECCSIDLAGAGRSLSAAELAAGHAPDLAHD